jgi:oxygen-independent coproporphyrinogen-3 oxidase
MHKSADVDPEKQAAQFLRGITILESAGYEHYEISSFATPGNQSRHNSSYWHSKKYLGLGPSAHSFNGISRQWNIANNPLYIKYIMTGQQPYELEILKPRDMLNEYIMTSLRTREGLDLKHIRSHFGEEKAKKLENQTAVYILSKQMENRQERLVLTGNGKLFADGIAAALFFD